MKLASKFFVLMALAAALCTWGCQRDEAVTREEPQQQTQPQPQPQEPGQTQSGQPQQQPGQTGQPGQQ